MRGRVMNDPVGDLDMTWILKQQYRSESITVSKSRTGPMFFLHVEFRQEINHWKVVRAVRKGDSCSFSR